MLRINLHNHTTYSDGRFTPEEIIESAMEFGLSHVAITDHYKTTKVPSLDAKDIPAYLKEIGRLKHKYRGKVVVLGGLEIDSCPNRTDLENLPYEAINKLDFVLFEYVQDDLWDGIPLWQLLKMRKKIQVPMGLAHNDLGRNFAHSDINRLINVLEKDKIFIELASTLRNSKFNKQYYHFAEGFFMRIKGRVRISIGSDTHADVSEVGDIEDAINFVRRLRLEENLITNYI